MNTKTRILLETHLYTEGKHKLTTQMYKTLFVKSFESVE